MKMSAAFCLVLSLNAFAALAQEAAVRKEAVQVKGAMIRLRAADAKAAEEPKAADTAGPKLPPMEQRWADLEKGENEATRALLALSDNPKESTAFLKEKLKPLKINADGVTEILVRLDSEDEKVWKAAFEELEYFDPRLAIDLQTLMDNVTSKPLRQRMVEVLSGRTAGSLGESDVSLRNTGGDSFNFFSGNSSFWAESKIERLNANSWTGSKKKWSRAVRAIVLLEHFKTPESIAILKDMATGHPDASPTKVAVEALKRIEGKDVAVAEPKEKMGVSTTTTTIRFGVPLVAPAAPAVEAVPKSE